MMREPVLDPKKKSELPSIKSKFTLNPKVRRVLVSAGVGLAVGVLCRALPVQYQGICAIIGKLIVGFVP